MTSSYILEFAKVASAAGVFDVYAAASDLMSKEAEEATRLPPKLAPGAGEERALARSSARAAQRAANPDVRYLSHALDRGGPPHGSSAMKAVKSGLGTLVKRAAALETKEASIGSKLKKLVRRPEDMSGTANFRPKSVYKNVRAGYHDAREGIARHPVHQAERDEGRRGLQLGWAEQDMPKDWGRAIHKGVKKLKGSKES